MQKVSALYREIIAGEHWFETKLIIGDEFCLIDESKNYITFGGTRIYYDSDSGGYGENMLKSVTTTSNLFADSRPQVGCCVAAEIDITMIKPTATIERMASLKPFFRAVNSSQQSEWLPKGIYYIDTRSDGEEDNTIVFHGYDAMLKAEQNFPSGDIGTWPKTDIDCVKLIASLMEVEVDARTEDIMRRGYSIQYPGAYSLREVLGYIAAMYAGNFIMSDEGRLRLIRLNEIGVETRYLVDNIGDNITFGGVRLLV